MRYRNATIDDLEILLQHRLAMFREMGVVSPEELANIECVSREYFESAIPADTFHAVLAETGGSRNHRRRRRGRRARPGASRRSRPRRAWILNVYVRPDFRRRGIARAIMENLVQWCESQGFDCVCRHASNDGRPLYEKLGFRGRRTRCG